MDKNYGLEKYKQERGTADEYAVPIVGSEEYVCWICDCEVDQNGSAINGEDHADFCPFVGQVMGKVEQRQDFVDNTIFEMFCNLIPSISLKSFDWDIEMIGAVRDVVEEWLVNRLGVCTAEEFYPSVKEGTE